MFFIFIIYSKFSGKVVAYEERNVGEILNPRPVITVVVFTNGKFYDVNGWQENATLLRDTIGPDGIVRLFFFLFYF